MTGNRNLNVRVDVIGSEAPDGSYSASATYFQLPGEKMLDGALDPNGSGDVNFDMLRDDPKCNWKIGMNFTLNAKIKDRNGTIVPCTWAKTAAKACVLTGPNNGPAYGMTVSPPTATMVSIINDNNDRDKDPPAERTYSYKLGIILPNDDDHYISLDPRITNTGPPGFGFLKFLKLLGLLALLGLFGRLWLTLVRRLLG